MASMSVDIHPSKHDQGKIVCISSIFDKLHDDLWVEIFCKVPNLKSIVVCKCVCKHWFSLISQSIFVAHYLQSHKTKYPSTKKPWTFWITLFKVLDYNNYDKLHYLGTPEPLTDYDYRKTNALNSNFIPVLWLDKEIYVAATFKDLVLYYRDTNIDNKTDQQATVLRVFYICNPFTRNWTALPPFPRPILDDVGWKVWSALICEDSKYSNNYKFRVVVVDPSRLVDDLSKGILLTIFCSESGRWKDVKLNTGNADGSRVVPNSDDEPFKGVVCNGMVCISYDVFFGAFCPFDVTDSTDENTLLEARILLPLPKYLQIFDRHELLESGGRLLVISHSYRSMMMIQIMETKLELDNRKDLKWWKKRPIFRTSRQGMFKMIGVHPKKPFWVYAVVLQDNKLVLWGARSNQLKAVTNLPPGRVVASHRLQFQWWPTPVPRLRTISH